MNLVIGLLVVIVLLLCTPLKRRSVLVRHLVVWVACGWIAYHVFPVIVGFLVPTVEYVWKRFGLVGILVSVGGIACMPVFYLAWRDDRDENKAIGAGSKSAFDKRVEAYKRDPFNYDHEKAVKTTLDIMQGKL